MSSETNFVEECLGPVDRIVISTCRFVDKTMPRDQWSLNYIVDLIEEGPDGGTLGMWYGPSHREAVETARSIALWHGNLPVVDRTIGGALQ